MITFKDVSTKKSHYKFIDKTREIPIKTMNKSLISAKVNVKIMNSFGEGITFIAVVVVVHENKMTFQTDLNGNPLEIQEELKNTDIL